MRNWPITLAVIAVFVLGSALVLLVVARIFVFVFTYTSPVWNNASGLASSVWKKTWRTDLELNPNGENGIQQIVTLIGMLFAIAGGVGLTASLTRTEVYTSDGTVDNPATIAKFRHHAPAVFFFSSFVPLGLMLGIVRADNHNSETLGGLKMFHYNPGTIWFGRRAIGLSALFVFLTTGYTCIYGFPNIIEGTKIYENYTFKTDGSHGILVRQPIYLSTIDVDSGIAVIETRMDKAFAKDWTVASVDAFDGQVTFQDREGDEVSSKWLQPQPILREESEDITVRTLTLKGARPEGRYTLFFRIKFRGKESTEATAQIAMEKLVKEKFTFRVQVKPEPVKRND